MAKDAIDAVLALPLKKGKGGKPEPPDDEPEDDGDKEDGHEDEAIAKLFEAAKGDDAEAFKEAFKVAVEACMGKEPAGEGE